VIAETLRAMLPAEVALAAGPVSRFDGALWPEERAAVARALAKRLGEFTAGRVAARAALGALGVADCAIPRGEGGAPVWPAGVVGSLSHSAGMVAAVVARAGGVAALGVDLEAVDDRAEGMADMICVPGEAEAARPWEAGILRVFSAKEAAFKALHPRVGFHFGFDSMEMALGPEGFAGRVLRDLGPVGAGTVVAGRQAVVDGFVVTAIVMRGEMWQE
jgi:4'-phosphopantetheinyl transferase EntD